MKVYNIDKTKVIRKYDLSKGYLVPDQLFVRHIEKVDSKEEKGHYEVLWQYENGGKDLKWVVDEPASPEIPAHDEFEDIQVFVPYSQNELEQIEIEKIKNRLTELSQDIVQMQAGAIFEDEIERKKEFCTLHNQLRKLIGKPERRY